MDKWFNSKWFVRAVSLAFAILIYVFVNIEVNTTQTDPRVPSGTDDVETLRDVPVDIRIDNERFVVSGVPESVTVSLEGPKTFLTTTATQRNFDLYVDLQELGEGTHIVDIEHDRIPKELSIYIDPKTIEVEIEERASENFEVSVDFINKDKLPEGYELGEPKVNPNKVEITSSRSVIDQIKIVKVYIDVTGLTDPINNREVPVNVYDSQGNGLNVRIDPASVVVSVDVDNPSKEVPVRVSTTGDLPEGYTLTSISADTEDVEVFATNDILAGIEELTTEEIDLSEITNSGTIETRLELPNGATVAEEKIGITIELEQTRVLENRSIDVESLDGQDVLFLKPSNPVMNVNVVGSEKVVSEFNEDDFQVLIDVKDLGTGEHEVPIRIDGPENVTVKGEFEMATVEIT